MKILYLSAKLFGFLTSSLGFSFSAFLSLSVKILNLSTKLFGFFELDTSFFAATEIKDKIFAVVIALMFGGLQILQQKLSSRPPKYQKKNPKKSNTDQAKQMRIMMYVMTIMFVFMCLNSTSLAIYWLIGAVYQIGQSQLGRLLNEYKYKKLQEKNSMEF